MQSPPRVERFHQSLLWPLRLVRAPGSSRLRRPWEALTAHPGSPWVEQADEYTGQPDAFHERHYQEFLTFLPYVQRVLFGEGRRPGAAPDALGESGMKTLRRSDVAALRVSTSPDAEPITLQVVHTDLLFFYDIDVALLNVELVGEGLALAQVQELLYRLGRAYPAGWDAEGQPLHSVWDAEWLDAQGQPLARSDARERERFIQHVQQRRAPRVAAHWAYLLQPMLADQDDIAANSVPLRYRQIEYYRMPVMAFVAVDDPTRISRADFVRLGLVTGSGGPELPYGEQHLADFESRYCWDRFWHAHGAAPHTRYLCCGHALVVVGRADATFFACRDRGVLAQFRHQHFLLFLLVHFQKAALLMFADRLVEALRRLNVGDPDNVRAFKREIRSAFEGFLRFTHRYWFHEVSEQAQARAIYGMLHQHLNVQALYSEVKIRIGDMAQYLETDSIRRQANTVVRLTVVTIFGLVGTITTGFLGMNLLAESDAPMGQRIAVFSATLLVTVGITVVTIVKSKRLSDFLDALSDERLSALDKVKSLAAVWTR